MHLSNTALDSVNDKKEFIQFIIYYKTENANRHKAKWKQIFRLKYDKK